MAENKSSNLLESLGAIENSEGAKEIRERLADIARRLGGARKGAAMDEILEDLARTQRVLDKNYNLKALYGLQVKILQEEAEFRRTGKRIVLD
ncbi:Uncharacterised protein [Candidatus Burarchaeum australiense]|nr:Uncharacterised protein [Candidatus Burarchaeum australiense]